MGKIFVGRLYYTYVFRRNSYNNITLVWRNIREFRVDGDWVELGGAEGGRRIQTWCSACWYFVITSPYDIYISPNLITEIVDVHIYVHIIHRFSASMQLWNSLIYKVVSGYCIIIIIVVDCMQICELFRMFYTYKHMS